MAAASPAWTKWIRRRSHLSAPGNAISGRSTSLAGSCVPMASAAATAASTSASEPVSREHRKSGNRLIVPIFGQSSRAILQPFGHTRS